MMANKSHLQINVGRYHGSFNPKYRQEGFLAQFKTIACWITAPDRRLISNGPAPVVAATVQHHDQPLPIAIKSFGTQPLLKDRVDRLHGTAARRSWLAAMGLEERGVGTPAPIGFLERWSHGRLSESYFITRFDSDVTSFRNELIRLYRHEPICERFMDLLDYVAGATRHMHDSGIWHRDLGNQNILLVRGTDASYHRIQFVDLNRTRLQSESIDLRSRAFDLSRIHLPTDLLRIFKEMYFNAPVPPRFEKWESFYRRRFAWHTASRPLRHPIRTRRRRRQQDPMITYPPLKDLWAWDDRSAQAISTMRRKQRNRLIPIRKHFDVAWATARSFGPVQVRFRRLMKSCYKTSFPMRDRVGIAVGFEAETADREFELLQGLGRMPVLLRFYRHQQKQQWDLGAQWVHRLHAAGYPVTIALVQDRAAVNNPQQWSYFASHVLDAVGDAAEWVEIGHAVNRVKWGFWSMAEYTRFMEPFIRLRESFPHLRIMGPAGIDFEYFYVVAFLGAVPNGLRFDALSHHLYVDRRGAPENKQRGYSSLEKFALARAIAGWSPVCDDRLIISEVNWPLLGAGVWSPVGSPYVSPQAHTNDPSVTEQQYANYMIRYLATAICSGMVERVYWWKLVARGFGLVDDTDPHRWRPRPGYQALRYFLQKLADSRFIGKPSTNPGIHSLVFEKPSGERVALAYAYPNEGRAELPFAFKQILDATGTPVAADGSCLHLGASPVYCTCK